MTFDVDIKLEAGSYRVAFALSDHPSAITGQERDLLAQFGPLTVDFGGSITGGATTQVLPANSRLVPTQLPVAQAFSVADYPTDANALAVAWKAAITTKLQNAIAALKAKSVGTLGHTTIVIT